MPIQPIAATAIVATLVACSAIGVDRPPQILERGPNHTTYAATDQELSPRGEPMTTTRSWTRLEDGINYWDVASKAWLESAAVVEIARVGAVATRGQHRVIFSPNVNDPAGAVDFEVNHRTRLRASVLALRYFDPASGKTALVATVQDARGELIPPNQVIYRNAFDAVRADVIYTYRTSGLEADLIIREVPPSPAEFQLPPEVTRLEVVTEFFDPPAAIIQPNILAQVTDPAVRAAVAEPDWIDEDLDFGASKFGPGRAFAWSEREAARMAPELAVPVAKRWVRSADGRALLIESVEYAHLFDELLALPGPAARKRDLFERSRAWAGIPRKELRLSAMQSLRRGAEGYLRGAPLEVPKRTLASAGHPPTGPIQWASLPADSSPGVVIDWTSISTGSSNMTFRGDQTYLVSGLCSFTGTTVVEGGSVIKFTNTVYTGLQINGPIDCRTSAYRPAIFTAYNDNSVGESIVAGTPEPNADAAWFPLYFYNTGVPVLLQHLRIKHAQHGLLFMGNNPSNVVRNCQFVNCLISVRDDSGNPVRLQNCLLDISRSNSVAFYSAPGATAFNMAGEHLTICGPLLLSTNGSLRLTNSILVGVTNAGAYSGASNYFASDIPSGTFSTVGSGRFYLPEGSQRRNAGTTNTDPAVASEIRRSTTQSPVLLTGTIATTTSLARQAQLDTDIPDQGYHYAPIDYCVSGLFVSGAGLQLREGTTVAAYGLSGLALGAGASVVADGSPSRPVQLLRYNCVQEGDSTNWLGSSSWFSMFQSWAAGSSNASLPTLDLRFAEFFHLALSTNNTAGRTLIAANSSAPVGRLSLTHSQVHGMHVDLAPPAAGAGTLLVGITNSCFELSSVAVNDSAGEASLALSAYNNYFSGNELTLQNADTNGWVFKDNLIASMVLTTYGTLTASNNGFRSGLTAFGSGNRTGLTLDFVSGPLGRYYYPTNGAAGSLTNLVDTGSRSATNASLYHFTTRAATGTKESNSTVDIGFHFAGVDASGQPADYDNDGSADAIEDRNGNGTPDAGETDWLTSKSGLSGPAALLLYTPLR